MDEKTSETHCQQENAAHGINDCFKQLNATLRGAASCMDELEEQTRSLEQLLNLKGCAEKIGDLTRRVGKHEELLRIANERFNLQQELIKQLLKDQASTSDQVTLITRQLAHQRDQSAQQMEQRGAHPSSLTQNNSATETYDYIFVSEDEDEATS
ncbi:hypothetical protein N7457_009866 [Penicillium paradoxum]|uniref:uncharacterized protein n=1 Tax=Penicillium paradoxum TaxID=176176 RepID=UPI0025480592|nr:uncharacterized protein N7457_009866 [Penicillium paradoxum]KAJ5774970.1 hypothetical protein N7457_009866 [Penicillium paradoxum]